MPRALGTAPDDSSVAQVTLRGGGLRAQVMTWGASVQGLWLDGIGHSLLRGSPDLRAYFADLLYFGAVVGPVANRIANARFTLDGRTFSLDANEGGKTILHGGVHGTGQRNWAIADLGPAHCRLEITQPGGLHGFPGPLEIAVTYTLEEQSALLVEVEGHSAVPALFAPAFHGYWTLDGAADLRGHRLQVDAESYLPVDADMIPLGPPAPVAGTMFDFRKASAIDQSIDHNLCLSSERVPIRPVAWLEAGKLRLELATTEPGLQVYASGGTSSGHWPGHEGRPFGPYAGLALEPQHWPDAANRADYPSPRIDPGQRITQSSRFTLQRL